ncbi:unnamed protein product [Rotaria sp. Silwood1]|nr:unnamed protein product [Rotaria sp. Silwood1]CAF3565031.1 unnamed protein product [Rotaria sp. Silwood1]
MLAMHELRSSVACESVVPSACLQVALNIVPLRLISRLERSKPLIMLVWQEQCTTLVFQRPIPQPIKLFSYCKSSYYSYITTRNIYVPLDRFDGSNPIIIPTSPGNGIFIYRLNETFLYPNAYYYMERLVEQIFRETKPEKINLYGSLGEQPWNLKISRHPEKDLRKDDQSPRLHALILHFTGITHLDIIGLQNLVDVRAQLDRYAVKKKLIGILLAYQILG